MAEISTSLRTERRYPMEYSVIKRKRLGYCSRVALQEKRGD